MNQEAGLRRMRAIQEELPRHLAPWVPKEIELTDIQNCLCETDKYLRVNFGEGKQKNRYVPGRGY